MSGFKIRGGNSNYIDIHIIEIEQTFFRSKLTGIRDWAKYGSSS